MTSYEITLHSQADEQLSQLPTEDRERLTDVLTDVATHRKPTSHSKCNILNNNYETMLYKVKVGELRALLSLDKPELRVWRLGRRQGIYQNVDEIYAGL